MVGDYNWSFPAETFGFQEFQGSLREENIDGDPRYFRTFFGPSENRSQFLRKIFGIRVLTGGCIEVCDVGTYYPNEGWLCDGDNISAQYLMAPVSFRVEPYDRERSHQLGTVQTTLGAILPEIDCGVLIEVEYRKCIVSWPDFLHDPDYVSLMNTSVAEFRADVPAIIAPTCVDVEHEFSLEIRTLKGRLMEICTFGSKTPAVAAGANQNNITRDDLEPWDRINQHTFTVTMYNVPSITLAQVRGILGHVNNDVWFGYPAHAVCCAEVSPRMKCTVGDQLLYDIEYKFVARWVPSNGEGVGNVMPAPGPLSGAFIYNGMVGVWNRARWEFPIAATNQHWWPITEQGQSNPSLAEVWPGDSKNLFPEANFHLAFYWWGDLCS